MAGSVTTPVGVLSWDDGVLTERTVVTLRDGQRVPLFRVITLTNGAVLPCLLEPGQED